MNDWKPATEAETAMRDALRANDQELYFQILSRIDLLLPAPAESSGGQPTGWGTWTNSGRTHVLAFTSVEALHACLGAHAAATWRTSYRELAAHWPNSQWWLAVNPGLPIEGYLPAWFVAQLVRGDVRIPGRTLGARARLERLAREGAGSKPVPAPAPSARSVSAPPPAPPTDHVASGRLATGITQSAVEVAEPAPDVRPAPESPRDRPAPLAAPVTPPLEPTELTPPPLVAPVTPPSPAHDPRPLIIDGAVVAERAVDLDPPAAPTGFQPRPVNGQPARSVRGEAGFPTSSGQSPTVPSETASQSEPVAPADSASQTDPVPPANPAREANPVPQPLPVDRAAEPPVLGSRSGSGSSHGGQPVAIGPETGSLNSAFIPANDVERSLFTAAAEGSTETFLSTLLLAKVLVQVAPESAPDARPGDDRFVWRTETIDGVTHVVVFTSPERRAEHIGEPVPTAEVKFAQLIRRWPAVDWSFAVNPGSPVGARLPGEQIMALANWAAEVGLGDDDGADGASSESGSSATQAANRADPAASGPAIPPPVEDPSQPVMMQKMISPGQLRFYLERGYDRVGGFVQRMSEVTHLRTPAELYAALGLGHPGSPFSPDAELIYALRWRAYRPNLYRIPYGGQNESAMRAMEGWMIERPPYRGNGFAPGDSRHVIAEFKVDSARLPHGAQLWRFGRDGSERLVATFDSDLPGWTPVIPS